jgi:hypothetical protein
VYETNDPFGGPLGVYGYNVNQNQSVAICFTPEANCTLDEVRLWLWNNDVSGESTPIRITLRNNRRANLNGDSMPGEVQFESWPFDIPYTGFAQPMLFSFPSTSRPVLATGTSYWIVAESSAHGGDDPVWAIAQPGIGFAGIRNPTTGPWQCGQGPVGATIVLGSARPIPGAK